MGDGSALADLAGEILCATDCDAGEARRQRDGSEGSKRKGPSRPNPAWKGDARALCSSIFLVIDSGLARHKCPRGL
jgi:hypothetical protein